MIPAPRKARRARALLVLASASWTLLWGCGDPAWLSGPHIGRSVSQSELVGQWTATAGSMERLKGAGYRDHLVEVDHRLDLGAEGACSFRSFSHYGGPQEAVKVLGRIPVPSYVSVGEGCSWRMVSEKVYVLGRPRSVPVVELEMHPRKAPVRMVARFYVGEEDGRLLLWDYVGEPDQERHMRFVRK